MLKSMTGFGRAARELEHGRVTIEIKSVNNRFRESILRMPKNCGVFEEEIKKIITSKIERGRIEFFLQLEDNQLKDKVLKLDEELSSNMINILNQLKSDYNIKGEIELSHLLTLNVVKLEEQSPDVEALWPEIKPLICDAVDELVGMRKREGMALEKDLRQRIQKITDCNNKISEISESSSSDFFNKLKNRLSELLTDINIDQARLAQEAAILAERADITEEIVRLDSHLKAFLDNLDSNTAIGRRLDFLLQEMGRETNTIGSKAQNLEVTNLVLDIKSELEKLREQIQNIE